MPLTIEQRNFLFENTRTWDEISKEDQEDIFNYKREEIMFNLESTPFDNFPDKYRSYAEEAADQADNMRTPWFFFAIFCSMKMESGETVLESLDKEILESLKETVFIELPSKSNFKLEILQ
jgi:hypothetical protein